jgi:hypothetical protein
LRVVYDQVCPINISHKEVEGKCDLKCSYSFKYSESNSTAKNNYLGLSLVYFVKRAGE